MPADLKMGNRAMHVPGRDSSFTPPKGRVDQDALRSGTAKTPKSLGPRDA